jgi:hypothetical protein
MGSNARLSGTTALAAVLSSDRLQVAHVGNSRLIIGKQQGTLAFRLYQACTPCIAVVCKPAVEHVENNGTQQSDQSKFLRTVYSTNVGRPALTHILTACQGCILQVCQGPWSQWFSPKTTASATKRSVTASLRKVPMQRSLHRTSSLEGKVLPLLVEHQRTL